MSGSLRPWTSAKSLMRRRPDAVAAVLILFATLGRMLCALTIINPLSGPDARMGLPRFAGHRAYAASDDARRPYIHWILRLSHSAGLR